MRLDNGLTTATLYVDGVLAGTGSGANGSTASSPIGFREFPGGQFHAADGNGVVSSVAIYSALGGTLVPSSEVSAGDPNLIVGWQLNGSGISVP